MSTVRFEKRGAIAYLTLTRAEKHNAITQDMWQRISDYLDEIALDKSLRALIFKAEGNKTFCAGADIEELKEIIKDTERLKANNAIVQNAQLKLQNLALPTIAAINGACVGGGLGIALSCDFRVAVKQARFGVTPAKLGLMYSIEDTKRLLSIVGVARAKELLYLAKIIDADTAAQWGLLTTLVENDKLTAAVDALIENILAVSRYSIAGSKATIAHITHINEPSSTSEDTIRSLFDDAFKEKDFIEGASAFIEKRKAVFK